ncbi:MAG TPA: cyclase family protein [Mycobacteriales bacterium]|jgi:kynurenine formamidase|nr:cyclase family protein [Mycobacteriales bacterium]
MNVVYGEIESHQTSCAHSAGPLDGNPEALADTRPAPRGITGLLGSAVAGMGTLGERLTSTGGQQAVAAAQGGVATLMSAVKGRVTDLTHAFGNDFPVIEPYVLKPEINHMATLSVQGFNANKLTIDEHTGTHLDGPAHLDDGQMFTDQIPIERLVAPLRVIRVHAQAAANPDYTLTLDDIHQHEKDHGRIPLGAFVVMDSGWAVRVPQAGAYLNRDATGTPHFPGLSAESVSMLVNDRGVFGAGVDTSSLDCGVHIPNPQAHLHLLGNARYGVENITNLATVPDCGAIVVVGLLRHHPGYAGPVRLIAIH